MLTNLYSSIHETFPDEHYHDVRNLQYWIVSSALTARYVTMFYQKTNMPENQTETIYTLIVSPFDDAKIRGIADNIEKRRFFLNITELESPIIASDYEEEEDNLSLERNKTEDEKLVDTGQK